MKKFLSFAALAVFSLMPGLCFAQHTPIHGTVKVLDGDTLAMGETRIRLYGIDAPESSQLRNPQGAVYWPVSGRPQNNLEGNTARSRCNE